MFSSLKRVKQRAELFERVRYLILDRIPSLDLDKLSVEQQGTVMDVAEKYIETGSAIDSLNDNDKEALGWLAVITVASAYRGQDKFTIMGSHLSLLKQEFHNFYSREASFLQSSTMMAINAAETAEPEPSQQSPSSTRLEAKKIPSSAEQKSNHQQRASVKRRHETKNGVTEALKPSNTEQTSKYQQAELAIKYRPEIREISDRYLNYPVKIRERLLGLLQADPKISVTALQAEIEHAIRQHYSPYENEKLNSALLQARDISSDAEAEFRQIVSQLGDSVSIDVLLDDLVNKYGTPSSDAIDQLRDHYGVQHDYELVERLKIKRIRRGRKYLYRVPRSNLIHDRYEDAIEEILGTPPQKLTTNSRSHKTPKVTDGIDKSERPQHINARHTSKPKLKGNRVSTKPASELSTTKATQASISPFTALENYADFDGRATRAEYWSFTLGWALLIFILLLFFGSIWVYVVSFLILIVPSVAVTVRRLHDINRAGWWYLAGLVPILNIILLVALCFDSYKGDNKWGPYPK